MKIVIAPDSYKESMSATEAASAMEKGIKRVFPHADCDLVPLADGGEGTIDAVLAALGAQARQIVVNGPFGESVTAKYALVGDRAVIEIAEAVGIGLVPASRRDVLAASSYGVGELIRDALNQGARRLIVGLGGSATNDGGAGMMQALGLRLLDSHGDDLPSGGAALARLAKIDCTGLDPRIKDLVVEIASDVTNPLLGPRGASAVFGPQKGAHPADVELLDAALTTYAAHLTEHLGTNVAELPGAGAGGGLGAALLAFFPATVHSGIDLVMNTVQFGQRLHGADYVFTGEGAIDRQTMMGKTPYGVARAASTEGVPVIAFAGHIGEGFEALYECGVQAVVSITPGVITLPQALRDGPANLERAVETVCRLLRG